MSIASTYPPIRVVAAMLLFGVLASTPVGLQAATGPSEAGVRLLRAQLPEGINIPQASCEQLARAVGRATLAHRSEASAILSAALTATPKTKRPCECVTRVFRVAVAAAPAESSRLLETASALYPDCAEAFATALDHSEDKNIVDDKNGPTRKHQVNNARGESFDPTVRNPGQGDPEDPTEYGDLNDRDISGLGFGGGFGPGFPGTPGFVGSVPSGGIALPAPTAETSVVNG